MLTFVFKRTILLVLVLLLISCGSDSTGPDQGDQAPKGLLVSTDSLDFGVSVSSLKFYISNTANENRTWNIIQDESWFTLDITSGSTTTENDTITVTIDRGSMSEGVHTGEIRVCGTEDTLDISVTCNISAVIATQWTGSITMTFDQTWSGSLISNFYDDITINFSFELTGTTIAGTGTGSHHLTVSPGDCSVLAASAPGFPAVVSGTMSGSYFNFMILPTSPDDFSISITLQCDDNVVDLPGYNNLLGAIMGMHMSLHVPIEDGGTDSGSGSEGFGEDPAIDYTYDVVIYEVK